MTNVHPFRFWKRSGNRIKEKNQLTKRITRHSKVLFNESHAGYKLILKDTQTYKSKNNKRTQITFRFSEQRDEAHHNGEFMRLPKRIL